jgi:hypothetical protein
MSGTLNFSSNSFNVCIGNGAEPLMKMRMGSGVGSCAPRIIR